jgi:ornithine carbamoyltransferase
MQRDSSVPRTPHSLDKVKIRQHGSKSLSKGVFNTPSPVINGKSSQKHMN